MRNEHKINGLTLTVASLFLTAAIGTAAHADIAVNFDEGAPKDRFSFQNVGECAVKSTDIELDLSGSKSGLIFDTTGTGAGVEVFQPLEIVAGSDALKSITQVTDGDTLVTLSIDELQPGDTIAFTIDVDDTAGNREITVSGSEIEGAIVRQIEANRTVTAVMSSGAKALLETESC